MKTIKCKSLIFICEMGSVQDRRMGRGRWDGGWVLLRREWVEGDGRMGRGSLGHVEWEDG